MSDPGNFGCTSCWPSVADRAWNAFPELILDSELIDESHFMVKLRSCPACRQQFVSVFAETIDWEAGNDPQLWGVLPVLSQEAQQLSAAGKDLVLQLRSLAPDRRGLCHDSNTSRTLWSLGVVIGPHD